MSKPKSYVGIKSEVSGSVLELHFTDHIYDGFDWETWEQTNMVQDTIDKVKAAAPTTINITINSLGGDVMIGLALYNFLKSYKAEKHVEIIGFAASIASVLAMCASPGKLKMAKNSFMIIHAAWSYAMGNAKEMREQAETLDKISNELADIYAQRSGKSASFFNELWAAGDYWMTGTEAKELGLVDEVTNAVEVNASMNISNYGFKNIPRLLINAAADTDFSETDISFLEGMIPHHQMAIDMAKDVLTSTQQPFVQQLAGAIISAQTTEIADIEEVLDSDDSPMAMENKKKKKKMKPMKMSNSINPKNMANKFPTIAAALGHEQMEHTEEGIFLQSAEAATIEAALSNAATSATALSAANATITEHVATIGTLQAAAVTAEETGAAQAARITALEAQVAELGSQASGSGTVLTTGEDEVVTSGAAPSYAADENPANAWVDKRLKNYKK